MVPWENFRGRLEAIWRKPAEERKSPAGRKPWSRGGDVQGDRSLRALQVSSDDQVEYQLSRPPLVHAVRRVTVLRTRSPTPRSVWLYREQLARAGMVEALFEDFDGYLEKAEATWRWAARSSTRRSYRSPSSATAVTTTRGSRMARRRRAGRTSRPSGRRRTRTHGGQRSTARATTVTRTMSTWTAGTRLVRRYQVTDAAVHDQPGRGGHP